jgi:hypothetical protein
MMRHSLQRRFTDGLTFMGQKGGMRGCLLGKFRSDPLGESGPESTRLSVNQDPNKGRRAKFWARGWNVYYKFHLPQPLFD